MKKDPQEVLEIYILAFSLEEQRTHMSGLRSFLLCFRKRRSCDHGAAIWKMEAGC